MTTPLANADMSVAGHATPEHDGRQVWYPDPSMRHQWRLASDGQWTSEVSDNGIVFVEQSFAPRTRRFWQRPWMIVLMSVVLLAGLGVVAFAVDQAQQNTDTYVADLRAQSGDFAVWEDPYSEGYYRADGYHVLVTQEGFVAATLTAPSSHTMLAAQVTVRGETVPPGAAFGPLVRDSHNVGYLFTVSASGEALLSTIDLISVTAPIATGSAPPLGAGTQHTLMITCVISGTSVRLAGYVDGNKVIGATPTQTIHSASATGMGAIAGTHVPAEWVATYFARRGPDEMPADARGG